MLLAVHWSIFMKQEKKSKILFCECVRKKSKGC